MELCPYRNEPCIKYGRMRTLCAPSIRIMKLNNLRNFSSLLILASICIALPARADDTHATKETPPPKKETFFFRGGRPLDFILALDRHFRTRLGEILSIPSSLARAQVPRIRLSTEDPADVLKLYNRLGDPLLGQWHYEPDVKAPATNLN